MNKEFFYLLLIDKQFKVINRQDYKTEMHKFNTVYVTYDENRNVLLEKAISLNKALNL